MLGMKLMFSRLLLCGLRNHRSNVNLRKTNDLRNSGGIIKFFAVILIGLLCLYHGNSWAHDDQQEVEYPQKRFELGIGVGLARFDTNFKFTKKDTGVSLYVDGEGTLGLPDKDNVPVIYGYYRFAKRHGIGFSMFHINRQSVLFQLDEEKDFHLGDLTVTAGAQANITLTDETSFYFLSYNYTIFDDKRSLLFASFGLYGLDLLYRLDASGSITLQGIPLVANSLSREASVFAPLPLFGLNAWYYFTPKWAMGTRISLVAGSYQEISGEVLDTTVQAKYKLSKRLGFTFGITYFNAELTIDNPDLKTEVAYGFDGIALGLDISF